MEDDAYEVLAEIHATATIGNFWELRAARLKGTAQGDYASLQSDHYAEMLTVESVFTEAPKPSGCCPKFLRFKVHPA